MTGMTMFLEDFGTPPGAVSQANFSDELLETERLEAFDKGYRAGWDDAIKAKLQDSANLTDGFAQALQDLSFTYHEAHAQILSNLTPLFNEILEKMLPSLARETLGAHISDQLSQLARDTGAVGIEIAVAPGAGEQVSQLVAEAASGLPITVNEVETVADGQAELRLGAKEVSVDLKGVAEQIGEAVHAVLFDQSKDRAHA